MRAVSPRRRGPALALLLALPLGLGLASASLGDAPSTGPFVYTDAQGSTRMVQSWDEVPAAARTRARSLGAPKVEYQSRVTTVTPERAARARSRAAELAAVPERRRESVIFYTASWCGYCTRTRSYLQQKGIAFVERDIDDPKHRRALKRKTGSTMVPVVQYEDQLIVGFNPRAIDALGL